MTAHTPIKPRTLADTARELPFEFEARELSDNEHFTLTRRREEMEMDCGYTARDIYWWEQDEGYHEDPAEFFKNHRKHFLEQAREEFAEAV